MELSEKEIVDNYKKLLGYIEKYIADPRKDALMKLYKDKEELIALAPASGKENYHNCFPGGYVKHVLNVLTVGVNVNELWKSSGAVNTHTDEELIFALLNHDLGKIGEGDQPYYVPNPSEWHRKNQGAIFTQNPKINFMTVPDRSLFLLQQYGIECTFSEYISIKIHDGLYDEGNKAYLMSYSEDGKLRTNLPFIVHQSDMIASRVEYQAWKTANSNLEPKTKAVQGNKTIQNRMSTLASNNTAVKTESASKIFDELFGK